MEDREKAFSEPLSEVLKRRVSVRSYRPDPVPPGVREKIAAYWNTLKGPFEPGLRFMLLDKRELKTEGIRLGTYGFIQGAGLFAAAAVEDGERALEQLGYVLEALVCYLTALGLGTCWLGGSFNKKAFAEAVKLEKGELLPAVVAVGFPGKSRTIVDFTLNPAGKGRKRKDWAELFFDGAFGRPLGGRDAGAYAPALEMVRIAPSASNKQPWRIVRQDGEFHFYLRHSPRYSSLLGFDIQRIDMGIAMFHFEAGAKEAGLFGAWETRGPDAYGVPENTEYVVTWAPK